MKSTENMKLDAYEEELLDAIENTDIISEPISAKKMEILREAAQKKLDAREAKKQISLKIRESDLAIIKQKAKEVSIPYQNIIQALLHKYASGQIKLEI